ncbi:Outer membrane protein ImpK/VasF, OmpA/MotB domain [hydrothermal vent metagenome]|uniref:Outer membrane protein ImpK/VasF, OmpA/MotB domain n=1 Tax=hydrothermal vent metagenome TaxID=652676 RepID=A0A3B0XY52_9ZZZZ
MSSGDFDKTVFKQPSVDADRTVIRPMPGGRGGQQPPAFSQQPAQSPPPAAQQHQPQQQAPQVPGAANSYFSTSSGLNPLVNAASILIAVFEKTRSAVSHPDVGGLHQRLVNEIKSFENEAKQTGIKPEVVLSARYAACAALDEAVLNTPWGSESAWPQRTLLSVFHNETSGGEKFFLILERMKEQPAENLYILELMYIFLSLGFEGKYRVIHRGRDMIEQMRDDLFTIIRRQRGEYERSLSPSWQGLGKTRNSLAQYIPMWVVASIVGAVLFLSYSGFRVWLYDSSSPVVEQLDEISDMRTIARQTPES